MATTFVEYTGDGNATKSFSFPSYQESDVKVRVDGVLKTTSTHYNITSYTTTGGGNVVFTSGNIPSSPANIRIYRDTNVDTAKATFTAGSSVKAADLNNNTTQLLYRAQEEQIPNLIHSYDIDDRAITSVKIAADAVSNFQLANDSVDSENYVDGSIDTAHIADAQITTAKLAADSVTGAKIADDQINSEHYVDGSIDTAHIADAQITTAKIADGAVTSAKFGSNTVTTSAVADANITTAKLAADAVTDAKIADDAVGSEHLQANSVGTSELANGAVQGVNIAADAIDGTKIADDAVGSEHIQTNSVGTSEIAEGGIQSTNIANNAVTTDKIADGELTTLAGMQSATASKLADSTALTADIADLNQIDGMAKQTTITDDDTKFPTSGAVVDYVAAQLEPFGGFEAIANESSFPNTQPVSGVAISIADAGGMVVSGSGTASGATVGGTTVNISGIASNFHGSTVAAGIRFIVTSTGSGQNYTYHKATLKEDDLINLSGDINDFSERYRVGSSNPTSSLDSGDLFFNTGTGKLLVYNGTNSAWEEAQSVGNFFINTISSSSGTGGGSATPNGTAYRFTLSNAGTNAEQHLVSVDGVVQKPNSGSSQPSEGFAVSGSDIIFGSAPVSGASIFVVTIGSTVNIGTPSNNTVTTAILQNGSVTTAKITDSAVTSDKIADGAIVNADVNASAAIAGTKISPDFGSQNVVTTGTLGSGDITISDASPSLRFTETDANPDYKLINTSGVFKIVDETNSNADRLVVNTDGHVDVTGNLDVGAGIDVTGDIISTGKIKVDGDGGSKYISVGDSDDLKIYHDANGPSIIADGNNQGLKISARNLDFTEYTGVTTRFRINDDGHVDVTGNLDVGAGIDCTGTVAATAFTGDGSSLSGINTDLVSDTTPQLGGNLESNGNDIVLGDGDKVRFGASNDLQIRHDGNNSIMSHNGAGDLLINTAAGEKIYIDSSEIIFRNDASTETLIKATQNSSVKLYHDNIISLETTGDGIEVKKTASSANAIVNVESSGGGQARLNLVTSSGANRASRIDFLNQDVNQWTLINDYNQNGTNNFGIRHGAEKVIDCYPDGAVEIYHDASKKLETLSTGTQVTGYQRQTAVPSFLAEHNHNHTAKGQSVLQNDFFKSFGVVRHNTGSHFNNSTGKFTAPVAGLYLFTFCFSGDGGDGSDDSFGVYFRIEGNTGNYNRVHGNNGRQFFNCNLRSLTIPGEELSQSFQTIEKLDANATVGFYITDFDFGSVYITAAKFSGCLIG